MLYSRLEILSLDGVGFALTLLSLLSEISLLSTRLLCRLLAELDGFASLFCPKIIISFLIK